MILKKGKTGKSRSQPKLQLMTYSGKSTHISSSWSSIRRPKHTPTTSCLAQRPYRNYYQRRSLQNITQTSPKQDYQPPTSWVNQFMFQMEVGKGAFGEVWRVRDQRGRTRALKVMHKQKIVEKNSRALVMNQRNILVALSSNGFIVNCLQACQDQTQLYLLMQFMPGGDLRYLMYRYRRQFTEGQAKFLVGCLILAIEHLHKHNIVHRDLKPQNLVLDAKSYLRVTDMGISRLLSSKTVCDSSGTPAYMAPQLLQSNQVGFYSDFYAVGVVAYQLLNGRRPYECKSRKGIIQQIRSTKEITFNEDLSAESVSFIRGLLCKDPSRRLGSKSITELYQHRWFSGVDWQEFKKKRYTSPFKEDKCDPDSLKEYNKKLEAEPQNENLFGVYRTQNRFEGYNYKPSK